MTPVRNWRFYKVPEILAENSIIPKDSQREFLTWRIPDGLASLFIVYRKFVGDLLPRCLLLIVVFVRFRRRNI